MIRSLVLLACALGAVVGFGGEGLFQKYAKIKVLSSCLGEDVIMPMISNMKKACDACKSAESQFTGNSNIENFINGLRNQESRKPLVVPIIYMHPQQFSQPQNNLLNQYYQPGSYPGQQPYQPQYGQQQFQSYNNGHSVGKRSPGLEVFDRMAENIKSKISNITCVLKNLNFIDDDKMPNYNHIVKKIQDLPVSEELRTDLLDGQEYCREFSMCLPVHKAKDPMTQELGYVFAYMKCMCMKKIKACVKQDIRKFGHLFSNEDESNLLTNNMDDKPDILMTKVFGLMFNGFDNM